VPNAYYCQVQHYLAGTGLSEWWVFGLIGNQRVLRIVPRNEDFIQDLIESERKFWELVESNDSLLAPMPRGTAADMDALMALGDPQQDSTVDLSEIEDLIDEYAQLRVELQDRDERREIVKQKIILFLNNSRYGESDLFRVTFSRYQKTYFKKSAFKKDHGDLFGKYTETTEVGRLSVRGRS